MMVHNVFWKMLCEKRCFFKNLLHYEKLSSNPFEICHRYYKENFKITGIYFILIEYLYISNSKYNIHTVNTLGKYSL